MGKLIQSVTLSCNIQQFRARMQRLINHLGTQGWYSSDSHQRLVLGEYPYMQGMYYTPATGVDLYGVGTFSAFDWRPNCDEIATKTSIKRSSTHASWQVLLWRKSSMRPEYHPIKGIYSAGIEAYEEANGLTRVEFLDGYDPDKPLRSCLEIGPAFVEFCNWIIQEVGGEVAEPTPAEESVGDVTHITLEQAKDLLSNRKTMLPFADRKRGYDSATAIAVVNAMLKARRRQCWERWGPSLIAKYCQPKRRPETVGYYLKVFFKRGIRTIEGVEIPRRLRQNSRQ